MSRLFIELYLDEDVDVLLAKLLRARGFVAITTREAGQLGSDDAAQLAYAVSHQKTFFTPNRTDRTIGDRFHRHGHPTDLPLELRRAYGESRHLQPLVRPGVVA